MHALHTLSVPISVLQAFSYSHLQISYAFFGFKNPLSRPAERTGNLVPPSGKGHLTSHLPLLILSRDSLPAHWSIQWPQECPLSIPDPSFPLSLSQMKSYLCLSCFRLCLGGSQPKIEGKEQNSVRCEGNSISSHSKRQKGQIATCGTY